jgi:hypothetical protein
MERDNPRLVERASALVVLPIVGLLGGLGLGAIAASITGAGEITSLVLTIRWGVTGFFLGLALVVVLSASLRRKDLVSIRGLIVLVVIAGVLSWFFTRILFGVLGY